MRKRIVTAAILIPVLILVALVAPKIVAAVVWGLLMMVGVYELLYTTGICSPCTFASFKASATASR